MPTPLRDSKPSMKKSGFRFLAVLLLFAAFAGGTRLYAMFTAGSVGHLSKSDCAGCHLAGKNVNAQQAAMLTTSQEVQCGRCHATAIQVSHPSGFVPRNKPPAMYPLDWKGDLTCSTCHEVHGSSPGLMRGGKLGKELCFACHEADFFKKMRDGGASMQGGHLDHGGDGKGVELDVYSRQCLECHSQNGDPKSGASIDRKGVLRHASRSVNHPIGIDYQKAAAFGGYRPRQTVERKLLLPNGRISCVSCHQGYMKEHGKLVLNNVRSTLCFECHDL
jgi:predicted CXXCH cytochrome family protein